MAAADDRTWSRRGLGPVVMVAGILAGAVGGIDFSDCVLCTLVALGAWYGGTLVAFAGAVIWQWGGERRPLVRGAIVVAATAVAFYGAAALRFAIVGLVTGGI